MQLLLETPALSPLPGTPVSTDLKSPFTGASFGGGFGKCASFGANSSSSTSTLSPARKPSMATAAFHQAKGANQLHAGQIPELTATNKDLEDFLRHKKSFVSQFVDFKLDNFSNKLREAMSTKKAANKLLAIIGRGKGTIERKTNNEKIMRLGPSAILEYAKQTTQREYVNDAYSSKVVTDKQRVMLPKCERVKKVSQMRKVLEATSPLSLPELKNQPCHVQALHQQKEECTVLATPALAAWEKSKKAEKTSAFVTRSSNVLVVTGSVNYSTLLAQQEVLRQESAARHADYERLMQKYDAIQDGIQRKFSQFLKGNLLTPEDETAPLVTPPSPVGGLPPIK